MKSRKLTKHMKRLARRRRRFPNDSKPFHKQISKYLSDFTREHDIYFIDTKRKSFHRAHADALSICRACRLNHVSCTESLGLSPESNPGRRRGAASAIAPLVNYTHPHEFHSSCFAVTVRQKRLPSTALSALAVRVLRVCRTSSEHHPAPTSLAFPFWFLGIVTPSSLIVLFLQYGIV